MSIDIGNYPTNVRHAVKAFWTGRLNAAEKQKLAGKRDQGNRGKATGGKNLDALSLLLNSVVRSNSNGILSVHLSRAFVTLPGYFRPTKQWDIVVMRDDRIVAVIELKSVCGPSFGNNVNNRTEEALGSGIDLKTAIREGAFGKGIPPFVGFVILIEEAEASSRPVKMTSHHFPTDPAFDEASYIKRLDLACDRMMREGLYSSAAVIVSPNRKAGQFSEVCPETGIKRFLLAFAARMSEESQA
jgi:hypothetical protein